MKKTNNPPKNDIDTAKDAPREMPEFDEYKVYEALIDRTRDISPIINLKS